MKMFRVFSFSILLISIILLVSSCAAEDDDSSSSSSSNNNNTNSDTESPTLNNRILTVTSLSGDRIEFSWEKASDNDSDDEKLTYNVYISAANPSSDDFDTLAEISSGVLVYSSEDIDHALIENITNDSAYYFGVVVEDEDGNQVNYDRIGEFLSSNYYLVFSFDGNATDISKNNHDGTLNNAPSEGTDRFENAGKALVFDSSFNQSVITSIQGFNSSDQRTISYWFKGTGTTPSDYQGLFSWGNSSNQNGFGNIIDSEDGKLKFANENIHSLNIDSSSSWEHWAFSFDGSGMKIFKNGAEVFTKEIILTASSDETLYIGSFLSGSENNLDGSIDDFRVFDVALNSSDIEKLFLVTKNEESTSSGISATFNAIPSVTNDRISIATLSSDNFSISWDTAIDDLTQSSDLIYHVYLSEANPATTDFETFQSISSGTLLYSSNDVNTALISGLTAGNSYYVNILVEDESGNKLLYSKTGAFVDDNLFLSYTFDGDASDITGNGRDGTLNNSPSLVSDRFGQENKAFEFQSSSSQNITSNSITMEGSDAFSVSFWFKASTTDYGSNTVIFSWGTSGTNASFTVGIENTADEINLITHVFTTTGESVSLDWEQWVFTFNGTVIKGFKNGAEVFSDNRVLNVGNSSSGPFTLNIGSRFTGSAFLDGTIDDFQIFDRELTESEVQRIYNIQNFQ